MIDRLLNRFRDILSNVKIPGERTATKKSTHKRDGYERIKEQPQQSTGIRLISKLHRAGYLTIVHCLLPRRVARGCMCVVCLVRRAQIHGLRTVWPSMLRRKVLRLNYLKDEEEPREQ